MNKKTVIFLACGCILVLCIVSIGMLFFTGSLASILNTSSSTGSNSSNVTNSNLVDCTFKSTDSVTNNSTYKTLLYSPVIENDSYKDLIDTGKRTFSIAELNRDRKSITNSFVLRFEMANERSLSPLDVEISFQLCDSNNKTKNISFISPSSDKTYAIIQYAHQGRVPETPGIYRADAVLRLNGVTTLIDREENIRFEK
jgi:hypothetical protein